MTDGSDLLACLEHLQPPQQGGYNVVPVPGQQGYRVGRGVDGQVVVLTPPDPDPDPPKTLLHLSLAPRMRCRVEDASGQVRDEDWGLIAFQPDDRALVEPFLEVAAALIRLLGPDPAPGQVSQGMRRLVRLFDRNRSATGDVLGLWGELLTILQVAEPAPLVDAWHAKVDARFDFATEGERLEVKTTGRSQRVHRFSLEQLLPVDGTRTRIVSIMTTQTAAGTSVRDLVRRLESQLAGDPERQLQVHDQVAATLGPAWMHEVTVRFDEHQAIGSLRVLDAQSVPRVEPGPTGVLAVDLTVDCTVAAADASGAERLLDGLRAAAPRGARPPRTADDNHAAPRRFAPFDHGRLIADDGRV